MEEVRKLRSEKSQVPTRQDFSSFLKKENIAALYLHIPFCKQACHYCDFHFSTSMKKKGALVASLCKELILRKNKIKNTIETIYFGGGTPSLLTSEELDLIFQSIFKHYNVAPNAEITLEANPDDLTKEKLKVLAVSPINRLSIGIQSFFKEDLKMMNRAHNATEALGSIQLAQQYFENLSIDLIYGIPGMSNNRWKENLETAVKLKIPHISSYALTVEPKTALKKMIEKGKIAPVNEELAFAHYNILTTFLTAAGFDNYEFSNFGRDGYFSRNNTSYWFGKPYLGIGPSAHSFDGDSRKWNISNNISYIKAIEENKLPAEEEKLTTTDKYNEHIMTRLRTKFGISLPEVEEKFDINYKIHLLKEAERNISRGNLLFTKDTIMVSKEARFKIDGIAADLFLVP